MKKTIYIAAPSCIATGGPELLHQLCFKLNKFGFHAKMFYYANTTSNLNTKEPIHQNYMIYNNPYTQSLDEVSNEGSYLIIPEGAIELMQYVNNCKIVIWWLSVDNYFDNIQNSYNQDIKKSNDLDFFRLKEKEVLHFAQSYYAKDFLINKIGIDINKIFYLSDYLRNDFCKINHSSNRNNYCLFNPKKGLENVLLLMSKSSNLTWLPIMNMMPEQVVSLMDKSKVYIDFGEHPGKDRIPREAAIRGLCVITNKAGSAANEHDVPIPDKYKFEDVPNSTNEIIELIQNIYLHFDEHEKDFESYRKRIAEEEQLFDDSIVKIFQELEC